MDAHETFFGVTALLTIFGIIAIVYGRGGKGGINKDGFSLEVEAEKKDTIR